MRQEIVLCTRRKRKKQQQQIKDSKIPRNKQEVKVYLKTKSKYTTKKGGKLGR